MKTTRSWLGLALFGLFLVSGCADNSNPGEVPASKDGASTHAAIENPTGVKDRPKSTAKGKGELPPQPPK